MPVIQETVDKSNIYPFDFNGNFGQEPYLYWTGPEKGEFSSKTGTFEMFINENSHDRIITGSQM